MVVRRILVITLALSVLISTLLVNTTQRFYVYVQELEIDVICYASYVVDGDTFDCQPGIRIRLADIDAPEYGEPGYYDAKEALKKLILYKLVYLDVDDYYVTDRYGRLVALVYVRYNKTHLLNVNKWLIDNGYAVISDYVNEFNPYTWKLYIYYPEQEPVATITMTTTTTTTTTYTEIKISTTTATITLTTTTPTTTTVTYTYTSVSPTTITRTTTIPTTTTIIYTITSPTTYTHTYTIITSATVTKIVTETMTIPTTIISTVMQIITSPYTIVITSSTTITTFVPLTTTTTLPITITRTKTITNEKTVMRTEILRETATKTVTVEKMETVEREVVATETMEKIVTETLEYRITVPYTSTVEKTVTETLTTTITSITKSGEVDLVALAIGIAFIATIIAGAYYAIKRFVKFIKSKLA